MGSSNWSDKSYDSRSTARLSAGIAGKTSVHTAAISSGTAAAKVHKNLDPKGVKLRESRDSKEHPKSRAIAVLFDVTGSMQEIPAVMQTKLSGLMAMLLKKGYVEDPAILFGAIGDAYSDQAPLQIGQFESGVEMDEDMDRLWLEGNGGGQKSESYDLGMYFMARHTSIDCFEKRGEKGYLFLIGDEMYYPHVRKSQVRDIIGDGLEADLSTEAIAKELQKTYEVFFIIPQGASHSGDKEVRSAWKKLFGQNVIDLNEPENVCECIASVIGLAEGKVDIDGVSADLKDIGVNTGTVSAVVGALTGYADTRALATKGSLPDSPAAAGAERL